MASISRAFLRGPNTAGQAIQQRSLSILRKNIQSSDVLVAAHAAEGLSDTGLGLEVRSIFLPRFLNESNQRSRCLISRELFRAGDEARLDVLINSLEQSEATLQILAAESLFKVRQVGDENRIRRVLANTNNAVLRLMLFAVFACHGDRDSLEEIREGLFNTTAYIRKLAAWMLIRVGNKSDVARLKQLRVSEKDIEVCVHVDHALAALNDETGRQSLRINLQSDSSEVRKTAAEAARYLRTSDFLKELIKLLDDQDSDVRTRAAHALVCREN